MKTTRAALAAIVLLVSGPLVLAKRTEIGIPSEDARNTILTSRTHYKMPAFATAYASGFFIPGLRKAGDFRAASVLNTQGRALVYNAGPQFPSQWARGAAKAAGSELDLRAGPVVDSELAAWLAAAPRAHSHR